MSREGRRGISERRPGEEQNCVREKKTRPVRESRARERIQGMELTGAP